MLNNLLFLLPFFLWPEPVQDRRVGGGVVYIKNSVIKKFARKIISLHFWSVCMAENIFGKSVLKGTFTEFYRKLLLMGEWLLFG
jgi:hypothetical protein